MSTLFERKPAHTGISRNRCRAQGYEKNDVHLGLRNAKIVVAFLGWCPTDLTWLFLYFGVYYCVLTQKTLERWVCNYCANN